MADAPRSFPHPDEVAEEATQANEYMVTELPSVELVHPLVVMPEALLMCIHLEDGTNRHLEFPKEFLPDPPSEAPADEDERREFTDRCDDLMAAHAQRILRAVWN